MTPNSLEEELFSLRGKLKKFLLWKLRHEHDAEDLAQKTLLKAHRALASLKSREKIWPWLKKIASRETSDFNALRKPIAMTEMRLPEAKSEHHEKSWILEFDDLFLCLGKAKGDPESVLIGMMVWGFGWSSAEASRYSGYSISKINRRLLGLRQALSSPKRELNTLSAEEASNVKAVLVYQLIKAASYPCAGISFRNIKILEDARRLAESLLAKNPGDTNALSFLVNICFIFSQWGEYRDDFQPSLPMHCWQRGKWDNVWRKTGLRHLNVLRKSRNWPTRETDEIIAGIYAPLRDDEVLWDSLEVSLDSLLRRRPLSDMHVLAARIKAKTQHPLKAARYLEKHIHNKKIKGIALAHYITGTLFFEAGQGKSAKAHLKRFLKSQWNLSLQRYVRELIQRCGKS